MAEIQNAKKGATIRSDASAATYIPGYIITAVKDKSVILVLTYQANKLTMTSASLAKANGSLNYTMEDLIALLVKTGGLGSVVKETNGGTLPGNNTVKQPQNPSVSTNGDKQQSPTEPSATLPETAQTEQTSPKGGFVAGVLAVSAAVLAAAGLGIRELLCRRKNKDE